MLLSVLLSANVGLVVGYVSLVDIVADMDAHVH